MIVSQGGAKFEKNMEVLMIQALGGVSADKRSTNKLMISLV